MQSRVMIPLLVCVLGLLAGCTSSDSSTGESAGSAPAEVKQLQKDVKGLGDQVRTLQRRVDELDGQNAYLEKMLATAELDIRSRLVEMVQQEVGAGGRGGFAQRAVRPAPLPRPYLGFDAQNITPETAKELNLPVETGVVVSEVTEGAPADLGGLRKGDVLQTIDAKAVASRDALVETFGGLKPGQEIQLAVQRGKEEMKLKVTVGAR
jgi:S1-C subfamily serine protease